MLRWMFIDDMENERATYADHLSAPGEIEIKAIGAEHIASELQGAVEAIDGVLVDVDLSADLGSKHSGPGVAQDIRVAQQDGSLPAFPVIRFSMAGRVAQKIGSDASSDDLFDLKIDKDGLDDEQTREDVRTKMRGVSEVYAFARQGETSIQNWTGLTDEQWESWGHPGFAAALRSADRDHLRGREFMSLLSAPGLLINEELLAIRLGASTNSNGWSEVLASLADIAFAGVGGREFRRWWASGLDDWWFEHTEVSTPLSSLTVAERNEILSARFADVEPLPKGEGSLGDRPWRYCTLTLEKGDGFLPVDPAGGVRMTPRRPRPDWMDPPYAAIGPALEFRDPRLDPSDVERIARKIRASS